MNSIPEPREHGRGDDQRGALNFRLYCALVRRYLDLEGRESHWSRETAARAAQAEWRLIRRSLANRVVADDELLDRCATLACLGRSGHPLRVLFVGPPGSGKSHMAQALADALGGLVVPLDATAITEAGWSGTSLAEALAAIGGPPQLLGATIIVDELDKLRIHRQAHGNALDKYKNQQAQYLALLDRAGRISLGSGGSLASADVHVVATGAFADAWWAQAGYTGEVTREMLVGYGMLPEFVDRLDHIIVLAPPCTRDLARILAHAVAGDASNVLREAVAEFGYELMVDPGVFSFLAQSLHGRGSTGTRAGRAIIEGAVHRLLAKAIRENWPVGRIVHVTSDDLQIPPLREEPPERGGRGGGFGRRPAPRIR